MEKLCTGETGDRENTATVAECNRLGNMHLCGIGGELCAPLLDPSATREGGDWASRHRCFCQQPGKSHEAGVYAPFPFRVTGRHRHPIKGNGRDAARFRMSCSASSQILERVTFSAAALNIQFRGSCYAPGVCLVEGRCRTCCLTRRRRHIKRPTCIVCCFSTSIPVRLLRISSTM